MEKQIIKEALSNKYKNLGFDDKAFEGVADFAQTYIKEEADLATFINGAEGMLKGFQSSTDRLRTEKAQLEKEKNELAEKVKTLETKPVENLPIIPPETKPLEETPAWAKAIIEANANLTKEIEEIKQGESTKAILTQARASFLTEDIHPDRKALAEIIFRDKSKNITKDTKVEDLVENAKASFNELCSAQGVEGYIPKNAEGKIVSKSAAQEFVEKQQSNTESKTSKIAERLGIETKD